MSARAMLAKVQIGRKELGLHDDDYRATLERLTGKTSAKDLSERQLNAVLVEFKRRGWKPKTVTGGKSKSTERGTVIGTADSPAAKKARALWLSLWHLGVIRESSEQALEAFAKRQIGCDRLLWADQQQMFKLIEALKKMAERNGWSQDLSGFAPRQHVLVLKRRLINAQCEKLNKATPLNRSSWGADQLDDMIRQLGALIQGRAE